MLITCWIRFYHYTLLLWLVLSPLLLSVEGPREPWRQELRRRTSCKPRPSPSCPQPRQAGSGYGQSCHTIKGLQKANHNHNPNQTNQTINHNHDHQSRLQDQGTPPQLFHAPQQPQPRQLPQVGSSQKFPDHQTIIKTFPVLRTIIISLTTLDDRKSLTTQCCRSPGRCWAFASSSPQQSLTSWRLLLRREVALLQQALWVVEVLEI